MNHSFSYSYSWSLVGPSHIDAEFGHVPCFGERHIHDASKGLHTEACPLGLLPLGTLRLSCCKEAQMSPEEKPCRAKLGNPANSQNRGPRHMALVEPGPAI